MTLMRGLFVVDPGGHTGIAWGIINPKARTSIDAIANRLFSGSETIEGDTFEQAVAIYRLWTKWKRECVHQHFIKPDLVELIFEDFTLRGGQMPAGKVPIEPARITCAFEGYRMAMRDSWHKGLRHYTPIIFQQAGDGKRYQTRERLTAAGAWIRGREHERTAFAHMILRANNILSGR